jgi:rare lipoprotein A
MTHKKNVINRSFPAILILFGLIAGFSFFSNSKSGNENGLSGNITGITLKTGSFFGISPNNADTKKADYPFFVTRGTASYYADDFHGRKTANGETFNMNELTAAHRFLPFGTSVKVTNMRNGKDVIVRINDRGPYIKGRIIDLSAGAAKKLGIMQSGIVKVKLEAYTPES